MDLPVEPPRVPTTGTIERKRRRRSSLVGWIGLLLAFLGMSVAVMAHRSGDPLNPSRPGSKQTASNNQPSAGGNEKSGGMHFTIKFGDKKAEIEKKPNPDAAKEPPKEGKKGLKDWFTRKSAPTPQPAAIPPLEASGASASPAPQKAPDAPRPSTPSAEVSDSSGAAWSRFVEFAPLVGGLLGVALGVVSWIRREDHRVSYAALSVAGVALCWHWIALGVAVGVGVAILIVILSQLS